MGGGTPHSGIGGPTLSGLSPRGRGNRTGAGPCGRYEGSIPAWAGEPPGLSPSDSKDTVYPRVGGGTLGDAKVGKKVVGLSPRGRGNRRNPAPTRSLLRSIPAWAGEPEPCSRGLSGIRVYPRVGGGTLVERTLETYVGGLSPRGRGNPVLSPRLEILPRSIPAWAGEPACTSPQSRPSWVYPRVGGETELGLLKERDREGLSPRGRGNRSLVKPVTVWLGSIPAWAGEPTSPSSTRSALYGLSPRGRGNPHQDLPRTSFPRSIPAWAGEPAVSMWR